jgi:hypothetical protein
MKRSNKKNANEFSISVFIPEYNTKQDLRKAIKKYIKPNVYGQIEVRMNVLGEGLQVMTIAKFLECYNDYE